MKKKQKIQKLIDILKHEHEVQEYGLCIMEQTCQENFESDWCEKNCEYPMNCEKCIRKWILKEDV